MDDQMSDVLYDAQAQTEVVTISKADRDMAVAEINKARSWLKAINTPYAKLIVDGLEWALVALGEDIPD